jgi:hypothetical protein
MAKTSRSLTGDPAVKGAPTGYTLPVTNVMVSVGAGFVVPLVGEVKFLSSQIYSLQSRAFTWSTEVMFVIKVTRMVQKGMSMTSVCCECFSVGAEEIPSVLVKE